MYSEYDFKDIKNIWKVLYEHLKNKFEKSHWVCYSWNPLKGLHLSGNLVIILVSKWFIVIETPVECACYTKSQVFGIRRQHKQYSIFANELDTQTLAHAKLFIFWFSLNFEGLYFIFWIREWHLCINKRTHSRTHKHTYFHLVLTWKFNLNYTMFISTADASL